jgi:hypothetical protein
VTDNDGAGDTQSVERLRNHVGLSLRRGIAKRSARAPAVTRSVEQQHTMLARQEIAERLPHRLQISAGAVDQHNRRLG